MADFDFKVDFNDSELTDFVENFSKQTPELQKNILFKAGAQVETQVILSTRRNLRTRTNTLAGAWRLVPTLIQVDGGTFRVDVTNNQKYAAIHEFGDVIRPKPPRKFLAIPIRSNNTFPAFGNNVFPMPRKSGIHQADLWFHKAKSGKMFLMDATGAPAYRLVPSVKIRATGYITEGIKAAEPEIELVIKQETDRMLEGS
tara:strand:- start:1483 stop:2082 length:600 start_codon:yes stop_codon:yes gene_type:complete